MRGFGIPAGCGIKISVFCRGFNHESETLNEYRQPDLGFPDIGFFRRNTF